VSRDLQALQDRLGYAFVDRSRLEEALTHRSWTNDRKGIHNQRLEFLGDAVLQVILTQALFEVYPGDREGDLTRRRALLLEGRFLAGLAQEIGLDRVLRLGSGEETTGGRARPSILEDAFEALIGALSLDGGLEAARRVVLAIYGELPLRLARREATANPKGRLQEIVQAEHGTGALRYEVLSAEGEDHAPKFEMAALLNGRVVGTGWGASKRDAEEEAARAALAALQAPDPGR
jgi:ribonuclease-3